MDNLQKIKEFMNKVGPLIPIQAAKEIKTDLLFASAMLSELSSKKQVLVSHVKVGGSPLYYLPGQEARLQSFSKQLKGPEQQAFTKLQKDQILKDKDLDPLTRTALRNMKDFAIPLQVSVNGAQEIFWKWYLLKNDEASTLIKTYLGIKETSKKQESQKKPAQQPTPKPSVPKTIKEEPSHPVMKEKPKPKPKKPPAPDEFLTLLMNYFQKNNIEVLEKDIIRKNAEIDFQVNIPSAVGTINHYVKAKKKRLLNESDLASTYGKAQLNNLPSLLLTPGDLNKKAKISAETDFKDIRIIKI